MGISKLELAKMIVHNTDSVFFTFDRWQELDGPENIQRMMDETKIIAKNISDTIARPPIEIVLDHMYADYACLKKKCDIKKRLCGTP